VVQARGLGVLSRTFCLSAATYAPLHYATARFFGLPVAGFIGREASLQRVGGRVVLIGDRRVLLTAIL